MNVVFLGTGSGLSVSHRFSSGYLIQTHGASLLLEAGHGILFSFLRLGLDPNSVQKIFITHTHPDHAAGLIPLIHRMALTKRSKPLDLFMPSGVCEQLPELFSFYHLDPEKWPFTLRTTPVHHGFLLLNAGINLEAVSNNHLSSKHEADKERGLPRECYSTVFWIDPGRKVVYTSDTQDLNHLDSDNRMKGVQWMISECTHIRPETSGAFCDKWSVPHLVFTHISPETETAIRGGLSIRRPAVFAADGLVIEV
jgi:ribonuclease Z